MLRHPERRLHVAANHSGGVVHKDVAFQPHLLPAELQMDKAVRLVHLVLQVLLVERFSDYGKQRTDAKLRAELDLAKEKVKVDSLAVKCWIVVLADRPVCTLKNELA